MSGHTLTPDEVPPCVRDLVHPKLILGLAFLCVRWTMDRFCCRDSFRFVLCVDNHKEEDESGNLTTHGNPRHEIHTVRCAMRVGPMFRFDMIEWSTTLRNTKTLLFFEDTQTDNDQFVSGRPRSNLGDHVPFLPIRLRKKIYVFHQNSIELKEKEKYGTSGYGN